MSGGKKKEITAHFLKQISGEFDLESIHNLELSKMGVQDLSVIGKCTGLVCLNLSNNSIKSLRQLGNLKLLENLDVSCNSISSLDGTGELESLVSINLAGNMIMSTEDLRNLSQLTKLRKLRLKDDVHNYCNPVCQSTSNYKRTVLEILPQISCLDGEIVQGKGTELYEMCDEIDTALEECTDNFGQPFAYKSAPWRTGKYLAQEKAPNRSVEEAQLGFNEVLSHCKKVNDEALKTVMDADAARWTTQ